jgi:hypothetical protein
MSRRNVTRLRSLRLPVLVLLVTMISHPALAQVDFSGRWRPFPHNQDGSGIIGDAAGVPLTDGAKARAQSFSPEEFDMAEWVCRPHAFDYSLEGPNSQLLIWPDVDQGTQQVIAYHMNINQMQQTTAIYMDGRDRPPANALHTWSGFSIGEWDGNDLVVTTTHLKEAYVRRWGLMRSDQSVLRTRWRRIGNYMQATSILYDPLNMSEPYVRSTMTWENDPGMAIVPYPCEEATEAAVPRGLVRHFLPGQNPLPALDPNLTDRFRTPYEPRLGGAPTMYPEYIGKMKTMPHPTTEAPSGSTETNR